MNQTAHISLQLLSISNSVETKVTVCALTSLARPASITSDFLIRLVALASAAGPSGAPLVHLCAAGEGVFTDWVRGPQPLFFRNVIFFCIFLFIVYFQSVEREVFSTFSFEPSSPLRNQATHLGR